VAPEPIREVNVKTLETNECDNRTGAGSYVQRERDAEGRTSDDIDSAGLIATNQQGLDWMEAGAAFECTEW
jgi:hypothetical protein